MDYQSYADKILRLTVRLEQLARGVSTDTKKELVRLQKELIAEFAKNEGISTKKVLNAVKQKVKQLADKRYKEINKILGENSEAAAEAATIAENQAFVSLGVLADARVAKMPVEAILERSLMRIFPGIKGRNITVGDMIERFTEHGVQDVVNLSERAFREGLSVPALTTLIKESTDLQKMQAEGVARTAIQAIANQAREDLADEYGFDKELWLATLDSKTCSFCQGLDGKCDIKGKIPSVPAHPRCRCVKLYIPEGLSCKEMKDDLSRIERGEDGKSKSLGKYEDYGTWIQKQPLAFQQEVLGKERTKLLNDGKITFNKMYTDIGRRKTVKSLKAHYEGGSSKPIVKEIKKSKKKKAGSTNLDELLTSLDTPTKSGVYLDGIHKEWNDSIHSGLTDSVKKHNGKLNALKWSDLETKALASSHKKGDYIQFNKPELLKINKIIETENKSLIKRKELYYDDVKKALERTDLSKGQRRKLQTILDKIESVERWAIYDVTENPIRTISLHEGFHNVYRMNKLEHIFETELINNNVNRNDKYKVSEYGSSSESELFAEVGAAIEEGIEIPDNIKTAFLNTIKRIKK